MKILIACETSGIVREAFRILGHSVVSCDLLPSDDESPYHVIKDCKKFIKSQNWDLIIMHPPCTAICISGNAWYAKGMPKYQERLDSIKWTTELWELAKESSLRVAMENPVGVLPFKPTQYIQPWMFGHAESKKTGLWLYNLPPLEPTNILEIPARGYWDNQISSGQNKIGSRNVNRWKMRSKTYQGIASAMSNQWGSLLK